MEPTYRGRMPRKSPRPTQRWTQSGKPPSGPWARVAILLNLGRIDEATELATKLTDEHLWLDDDALNVGNTADIFGVDELPTGWAFFHLDDQVVLFATSVLDEFAMSAPLCDFADAFDRLAQRPSRRNRAQDER